MHSGGAQKCAQRSQPAQSVFLGHGLGCTFAKALYCCHRRRASGAFQGLPALKPVFDRPYACTVPQLGPQGRNERKRAGNLFRKWLRLRGQSIPREWKWRAHHTERAGARCPIARPSLPFPLPSAALGTPLGPPGASPAAWLARATQRAAGASGEEERAGWCCARDAANEAPPRGAPAPAGAAAPAGHRRPGGGRAARGAGESRRREAAQPRGA